MKNFFFSFLELSLKQKQSLKTLQNFIYLFLGIFYRLLFYGLLGPILKSVILQYMFYLL